MPSDAACAVLSIKDTPRMDAPLKDGWGDILRLGFYDIDCPPDDAVKRGLIDAKDLMYWQTTIFNRSLAREIIEWLKNIAKRPEITKVLIHCDYGHSRSRGVAKFIAGLYNLPFPAIFFNTYVYDTLCKALTEDDMVELNAKSKPEPTRQDPPAGYLGRVKAAFCALITRGSATTEGRHS